MGLQVSAALLAVSIRSREKEMRGLWAGLQAVISRGRESFEVPGTKG